MCGIVGLFLKRPELEARLGEWLAPMLTGMSERGPDSAGFAVYRPPAAGCTVKVTLHHPDEGYRWQQLWDDLALTLSARVEGEVRASHCVLMSDAPEDALRKALTRPRATTSSAVSSAWWCTRRTSRGGRWRRHPA